MRKEHLKLYMDLLGGDVKHLLKVSRNEFLDGVTTEKWELAAIQHFFQVMNCWRQQEKKGMDESTDFIERRDWAKPYYYLYQSIYGSHDWESITERDGDQKVPMVTGEVFRLDEQDWMKEKTAVRFYDVYRQIRALLEGDANEILPTLSDQYDLVFMDAAKGQYGSFFQKVVPLLAPEGILLCDNVLQDGDVLESRFAVTRRNRTIHARMREYLYELKHDERLDTAILNIGDGMSLSVKKTADKKDH